MYVCPVCVRNTQGTTPWILKRCGLDTSKDHIPKIATKNAAYRRHWISQHLQMVAEIPVTCHQRQQPQPHTLPLLTFPLRTVGWFAETKSKKISKPKESLKPFLKKGFLVWELLNIFFICFTFFHKFFLLLPSCFFLQLLNTKTGLKRQKQL